MFRFCFFFFFWLLELVSELNFCYTANALEWILVDWCLLFCSMCLGYVCMCVYSLCVRKTFSVLFYHFIIPLRICKVFLSPMLFFCGFLGSACLCHWDEWQSHLAFAWVLWIQAQNLVLVQQALSPLSHPSRLFFFYFIHSFVSVRQRKK